jgi:hypothetical protein
VGKSSDQIGRHATQNEELIGNDSDVFEKMSQAINSAYDLVSQGHYAYSGDIDVATIVVPVIVVPDGRVWTVWYNKSGEIEQEPRITSNIEYFINKSYSIGDDSREYIRRYFLSHMEIVQIGAVEDMLLKYRSIPILQSVQTLREFYMEFLKS